VGAGTSVVVGVGATVRLVDGGCVVAEDVVDATAGRVDTGAVTDDSAAEQPAATSKVAINATDPTDGTEKEYRRGSGLRRLAAPTAFDPPLWTRHRSLKPVSRSWGVESVMGNDRRPRSL